MFRTFRTQFLSTLDLQELTSLKDLNTRFWSYVESTYNRKVHSSLNGLSPMERYLKDKERFRFVRNKESLDRVFLNEALRRVNHDATITFMKRVYEVPQEFIGRQVTVQEVTIDELRVFLRFNL